MDFLIPNLGLILAIILVEGVYATIVRPRANDLAITERLVAA